MKALSMTQPWASLVMGGHKTIETRSWPTKFRGDVAIHAAKKVDANACLKFGYDPEEIPRGCILGIVALDDCVQFTPEFIANLGSWERLCGDFALGRFGFEIVHVRPFVKPIPVAHGWPGNLWNWEPPA